MLYVEQSLGPDEELVHIGNFHWFYTLQAFMAIFWGVVACVAVLGISVFAYIVFDQFPPNISYIQGAAHIHPGLRICAFVAFVLGSCQFSFYFFVWLTLHGRWSSRGSWTLASLASMARLAS